MNKMALIDMANLRFACPQITGYSTTQDCVGTFTYNVCTLESAVGEYDVLINDDKVEIASLGNPRILAIANNTWVDYSAPKIGNTSYSSTLSAIPYFTFGRYDCYNARLPVQGSEHALSIGSLAFEDYEIVDPSRGTCSSYSDPLEDVTAAINKCTSRS